MELVTPQPSPGVNAGAAVVFDGSGLSQRSAMLGTSASYQFQRLVPGGPRNGPIIFNGGTRAFTRRSGTNHPVWTAFNFYSVLDENRNSLFGTTGPDFFATSTQDTSVSGIRQPGASAVYQALTGDTSTAEIQGRFHTNGFARPSSSPAGLGARRTTRNQFGYTGGIVEIRERGGIFQGDYVFHGDPDDRGRSRIPGVSPSGQTGVRIFTDIGSNWMWVETGTENVEGANNNFYYFGTPIGTFHSRSAFIDDRRFIARDISQGAAATVGGNGFMGDYPIFRLIGAFVSAGMLGDVLPDDVTPCECEYLSWGYWSGDARRETTIEDRNNDREAAHIASWVAGEIPDAVDIPATGTASYAGHIVGNVKNGASYYVSAGRFTHQHNFATDTGTFSVTNFDGADYSGAVAASNLRNDFQGADIQGSSNRVMNLRGSFFKAPSQGGGAIPAYVGGDFNATGDDYKAGGIFAGER